MVIALDKLEVNLGISRVFGFSCITDCFMQRLNPAFIQDNQGIYTGLLID